MYTNSVNNENNTKKFSIQMTAASVKTSASCLLLSYLFDLFGSKSETLRNASKLAQRAGGLGLGIAGASAIVSIFC